MLSQLRCHINEIRVPSHTGATQESQRLGPLHNGHCRGTEALRLASPDTSQKQSPQYWELSHQALPRQGITIMPGAEQTLKDNFFSPKYVVMELCRWHLAQIRKLNQLLPNQG